MFDAKVIYDSIKFDRFVDISMNNIYQLSCPKTLLYIDRIFKNR